MFLMATMQTNQCSWGVKILLWPTEGLLAALPHRDLFLNTILHFSRRLMLWVTWRKLCLWDIQLLNHRRTQSNDVFNSQYLSSNSEIYGYIFRNPQCDFLLKCYYSQFQRRKSRGCTAFNTGMRPCHTKYSTNVFSVIVRPNETQFCFLTFVKQCILASVIYCFVTRIFKGVLLLKSWHKINKFDIIFWNCLCLYKKTMIIWFLDIWIRIHENYECRILSECFRKQSVWIWKQPKFQSVFIKKEKAIFTQQCTKSEYILWYIIINKTC